MQHPIPSRGGSFNSPWSVAAAVAMSKIEALKGFALPWQRMLYDVMTLQPVGQEWLEYMLHTAVYVKEFLTKIHPRRLGNHSADFNTLQLSNMALENPPFMYDFPFEISIYMGFPIAMFDYRRVTG